MNFDAILTAFINVLTPLNLIGLIFGVAVGIIIGALPGLSVNMGIALLFPLTFSFQGIGGILMLLGLTLGRLICGFLCPFGLIQELLHKIPAKKFSTKRFHILTYLKYLILVLFVIVLPMTVVNEVGMGDPFFCKYICPAGILEGGIPLALADAGVRAGLGGLFTWKSCILLGTALLAVFFYRPFCKWLCPLGAFYGLCNRISICRLQVDSGRCTACGACSRACRMDVDVFRTPNHAECIRCGDCAAACPHGAITRVFSIKRIQEKKETAT